MLGSENAQVSPTCHLFLHLSFMSCQLLKKPSSRFLWYDTFFVFRLPPCYLMLFIPLSRVHKSPYIHAILLRNAHHSEDIIVDSRKNSAIVYNYPPKSTLSLASFGANGDSETFKRWGLVIGSQRTESWTRRRYRGHGSFWLFAPLLPSGD